MSQPETDYFELLKKQKQDAFDLDTQRTKRLVRRRLEKLKPGRDLPRYLLRALESGDAGRVEACIDKAMGEGWNEEALSKAVDQKISELTGA